MTAPAPHPDDIIAAASFQPYERYGEWWVRVDVPGRPPVTLGPYLTEAEAAGAKARLLRMVTP
jgi:hypothetical protein